MSSGEYQYGRRSNAWIIAGVCSVALVAGLFALLRLFHQFQAHLEGNVQAAHIVGFDFQFVTFRLDRDAIDIYVPNHLHKEIAIAAAES